MLSLSQGGTIGGTRTWGALLVLLGCVSFATSVRGVPAEPVLRTLEQADGTSFKAWLQGDEWLHWWETEKGYTIVVDELSRNWVYADQDAQGNLVKTDRVVGKDPPPQGVPTHLKPPMRDLLKIQNPTDPQPKQAYAQVFPPSGTRRLCVLLINFADRTLTFTTAQFTNLLFNTTSPNDSMTEYYREVSYYPSTGSLNLVGTVYGPYTSSRNHDYYGQDNVSGDDMWPHILVREAVIAADSAVNFAQCDNDNNGYVDGVVVIHQGTGEHQSNGVPTDIWAHRWSLNSAQYWNGCPTWMTPCGAYTTNDGVIVNDYIIQPEIATDGGIQTIGVFVHEFGHLLGWTDVYDTDYSSDGVGLWSVMAAGNWGQVSRPGDSPVHPSIWEKALMNWITPTQITSPTVGASIPRIETNKAGYQLLNNPGGFSDWLNNCQTSSGEYFLVENRQRTGFDVSLPGDGLLIWHVDESRCTNSNESHKLLDVEEAHGGTQHLDYPDGNRGDAGDPFPGTSNKRTFDNNTDPNSRLYSGASSGACVTNISNSGSTMTADMGTSGCPPTGNRTLTVAGAGTGNGTVTGSGINCTITAGSTSGDCSETVPDGTTITLTASATSGSTFAGWTNCDSPSSNQCTMTMNANKTVTATFNLVGPANDNFANAQVISGSSGTTTGSNVGATKESGEPNHAGNAGGASVWYRWTAPSSGTATIDTIGSNFDTLLAVYTGSAVNSLTLIASNDDIGGGNVQSRVTFTATSGTTYQIAVDGYGGATGNIILNWSLSPASPANDNFANAQVISGSSGTATGSNVGATKESGEPNHAGNAGGASVWYRWTAPSSGTATIDTIGSNFDTLLAVYTGSAVNSLTLIAENDDFSGLQSRVTFTATSGTTYQIAVDGYNGATGNITLNWSLASACTATGAIFRIERATGNVCADGSFISGGADVAEYILASEAVEPGDVVELDPHNPGQYRKARTPYSHLVVGVISTNPGLILGLKLSEGLTLTPALSTIRERVELNLTLARLSEGTMLLSGVSISKLAKQTQRERPLLALLGRVLVKATTENGPIRVGDLLTSSSKPGYAMRCENTQKCEGAIIGKALEALDSGEGVILMLVMH